MACGGSADAAALGGGAEACATSSPGCWRDSRALEPARAGCPLPTLLSAPRRRRRRGQHARACAARAGCRLRGVMRRWLRRLRLYLRRRRRRRRLRRLGRSLGGRLGRPAAVELRGRRVGGGRRRHADAAVLAQRHHVRLRRRPHRTVRAPLGASRAASKQAARRRASAAPAVVRGELRAAPSGDRLEG